MVKLMENFALAKASFLNEALFTAVSRFTEDDDPHTRAIAVLCLGQVIGASSAVMLTAPSPATATPSMSVSMTGRSSSGVPSSFGAGGGGVLPLSFGPGVPASGIAGKDGGATGGGFQRIGAYTGDLHPAGVVSLGTDMPPPPAFPQSRKPGSGAPSRPLHVDSYMGALGAGGGVGGAGSALLPPGPMALTGTATATATATGAPGGGGNGNGSAGAHGSASAAPMSIENACIAELHLGLRLLGRCSDGSALVRFEAVLALGRLFEQQHHCSVAKEMCLFLANADAQKRRVSFFGDSAAELIKAAMTASAGTPPGAEGRAYDEGDSAGAGAEGGGGADVSSPVSPGGGRAHYANNLGSVDFEDLRRKSLNLVPSMELLVGLSGEGSLGLGAGGASAAVPGSGTDDDDDTTAVAATTAAGMVGSGLLVDTSTPRENEDDSDAAGGGEDGSTFAVTQEPSASEPPVSTHSTHSLEHSPFLLPTPHTQQGSTSAGSVGTSGSSTAPSSGGLYMAPPLSHVDSFSSPIMSSSRTRASSTPSPRPVAGRVALREDVVGATQPLREEGTTSPGLPLTDVPGEEPEPDVDPDDTPYNDLVAGLRWFLEPQDTAKLLQRLTVFVSDKVVDSKHGQVIYAAENIRDVVIVYMRLWFALVELRYHPHSKEAHPKILPAIECITDSIFTLVLADRDAMARFNEEIADRAREEKEELLQGAQVQADVGGVEGRHSRFSATKSSLDAMPVRPLPVYPTYKDDRVMQSHLYAQAQRVFLKPDLGYYAEDDPLTVEGREAAARAARGRKQVYCGAMLHRLFQDCDEQLDNYERQQKEVEAFKDGRQVGASAIPKSLTHFRQRAIISLDTAMQTSILLFHPFNEGLAVTDGRMVDLYHKEERGWARNVHIDVFAGRKNDRRVAFANSNSAADRDGGGGAGSGSPFGAHEALGGVGKQRRTRAHSNASSSPSPSPQHGPVPHALSNTHVFPLRSEYGANLRRVRSNDQQQPASHEADIRHMASGTSAAARAHYVRNVYSRFSSGAGASPGGSGHGKLVGDDHLRVSALNWINDKSDPLLAVGASDGTVRVFRDAGDRPAWENDDGLVVDDATSLSIARDFVRTTRCVSVLLAGTWPMSVANVNVRWPTSRTPLEPLLTLFHTLFHTHPPQRPRHRWRRAVS